MSNHAILWALRIIALCFTLSVLALSFFGEGYKRGYQQAQCDLHVNCTEH